MAQKQSIGWKRYNVFISSTFKDMDFERDIIKHKVIPMLNARFRPSRVELQAVDLRMGVNTEQMSEDESANKVLQVCAQCIDESRPFFIGLVGARYGWIPPKEYWQRFVDNLPAEGRELMKQTYGKSVTEMEIIYGALSRRSLETSHTLFYFRDDSSYEGMPRELVPIFCDEDPALKKKLAALKERIADRISQIGGRDDRVSTYQLRWDHETGDFDAEDSDFERIVTEQMARQIEMELSIEDEQPWWQVEKQAAESYLSRLLPDICTSLPYYDERVEQSVFCGDVGSGRSTLLAWQWQLTQHDTDDICLVGIVGLTSRSSTMRSLLTRWCVELADAIGEEPCDVDKFLDEDETPFPDICDDFYWLVREAQDKHNRRISLFIDEADRFYALSPDDALLSWIDYRVNALVTCSMECVMDYETAHTNWDDKELKELESKDMKRLIKQLERKYRLELPQSVEQRIMAQPRTPVYPVCIIRIVGMLGGSDFSQVRKEQGSPIDVLNQYVDTVVGQIFHDDEDSLLLMPSQLATVASMVLGIDEKWWMRMLGYLSKSPTGLRQKDLEALGGEGWDATEWAQLTYFLQDFVEVDSQHVWHSKYEYFGYDDDTPYEDLADYVEELPDDDWLKSAVQAYYVIRTEDKDYYESSEFSMSPETVYLLLKDGWLYDGRLADFCKQLDRDDQEQLIDMLRTELFPKEDLWELDQQALDAAKDNLIDPLDMEKTDREEMEDVIGDYLKVSYEDQNRFKTLKVFESIVPEIRQQQDENPYIAWTRKALSLRNGRTLFGGRKNIDEVRYLVQQLTSLPPSENRYNDEMLLENLTLQFITLYGAVWHLRNNEKQARKVGDEVLTKISSLAEEGFQTTFHRLCQLSPENRLAPWLRPLIELTFDDYPFSANHAVIRDVLDDLREVKI